MSTEPDQAALSADDFGQEWHSSFLEHLEKEKGVEDGVAEPSEEKQEFEECELESLVLRDFLELEACGLSVGWPRGLDARIAKGILSQREAGASVRATSAVERSAAVEGLGSSSSSTSSDSSSSSSSTGSESREPQPKRQRTRRCRGSRA